MAPKSSETLVPRHPTAERLLEAAIRSMDADGEAGLRVDAVVSEAGVTIPVLYHHFGNREGLVRAAHVVRITRGLDEIVDSVEAALGKVEDREGFIQIMEWILESVSRPSDDRYIRLNVLGATYGRPDLQAEVAKIQRDRWEHIAELFAGPQQKGWIRADLDLVVYVGWMFGMFLGRALIDIQGDAVDGTAWDRYARESMWMVLWGEAPPA
jgi:AcrR family transcriptional regulator